MRWSHILQVISERDLSSDRRAERTGRRGWSSVKSGASSRLPPGISSVGRHPVLSMGNAQSPPSDPRFLAASRLFSKNELEDLRSLFSSLAAQSRSSGQFVSLEVFKGFFGIHGALGDRLFDLITQERRDGRLTFKDLVIAKGTYEKGAADEIEDFVYRLCDANGDGMIDRSDLEIVLISMLGAIFPSANKASDSASRRSSTYAFIDSASFSKQSGGDGASMSTEDFQKWHALLPSVWKFLGNLLSPPDPGRPGFQVPLLQHPNTISPDELTLKREHAWHIGGALSQHEMVEWKLLYHSTIHGLSFATFLGNILSNGDGPTVLVIKDKEDCIFGGYASQRWEKHSDFYGDMKTFLFQLHPKASIFRPNGINSNLQWCAVNFNSDSIPNGIGFGGQAGHFGVFLSASFEEGHTHSCTTFGSPCLAKTSRIQPQVIECWGISTKGAVEAKAELQVKGTVLQRFKEDRNMLKMVGLANSSD